MPFQERPFDDESVLRTDEQASSTGGGNYSQAEKEYDPAHPPLAQPLNQKGIKPRRPTQKDQLETSEREDPSKAVKDSYQDS